MLLFAVIYKKCMIFIACLVVTDNILHDCFVRLEHVRFKLNRRFTLSIYFLAFLIENTASHFFGNTLVKFTNPYE
jgi:hypothetical protein